ncbi:MerR family transcriptional regulator [Paucibacter sp. KBW04]|uniref:MerR family transcriptional regulator n=1 Tax=Paucibacter sp. KBW04 TaxID=2153361 RepID=UPI0018CC7A51|nr:MerR family transcriptional regulator [Paucibacter sp. KBW04]
MDYSVGDLAKRCGLTVRALHHYEKLGLLKPTGRTEAGYRQYGEADVLRLHRLMALRQSGLALKQVGALLDAEHPPLREVLARQIEALEQQVQEQQHLLRALRQVQDSASASSEDLISQLMRAMSMMRVHQKYFDAAQLKLLAGRRDALGEEALRASETAWPLLIQEVQAAMAAGVDPASPQVLALARRWQDLTRQFVGEDAGIQSKVREMYAKEPELQRSTGVTPALLAFLRQALLQPSPASAP